MTTLSRMSAPDLAQLVTDVLDGKVFTDRNIDEHHDVLMVFALLGLMGAEEGQSLFGSPDVPGSCQVGMVYEYLDRAGPMSVNGYPMFLSVRFLHVADMPAFFAAFKSLKEQRATQKAMVEAEIVKAQQAQA